MVNDVTLDAISIDTDGRLFFEVNDQGVLRSYEFNLSIDDLHTLARYAINAARDQITAARDRINGGSTVLRALDARDLP
jgi:hypothetical protein